LVTNKGKPVRADQRGSKGFIPEVVVGVFNGGQGEEGRALGESAPRETGAAA